MSLVRCLGVLGVWLCASCAASGVRVGGVPREHIDVPEAVDSYSTDAAPDGVIGGAPSARLAAEIQAELAKRGTPASADGALAATASWVLREANEGRTLSVSATDAAARRFGFAGVVTSMAGFGTEAEGDVWRNALALVPPNMPITRFGVSASNSGRSAAVVFGAVEISVQPFARHLTPSDKLDLRGEVGPRYSFAHVYLTKADGSVEERRTPSRKIDTSFSFATPGKYEIEVMGDGATGPVIVFNVPVYVGVDEEQPTNSTGHATSPADGEARMLELLNRSRKAAGLAALQTDDELREIALAHSTDMAEHSFFGHVSPTTGTTDDRARRSGVIVATLGENVAEADSAEAAHDGLMASPGHRANMLGAQFTHVGIAAVSTDSKQLAFTLIFARRPNPATMPRNAAQVEAAFLALRAKKGLSRPVSDAVYGVAVAAGVRAYVEASKPSPEVAVRAENTALAQEVQRTRSGRPAGCSFLVEILELEQLEQAPILVAPGIRRYGLAARIHQDAHGPRLTVMMALEGAPCK